jgi:Domain of unknown function (DUF1707)
LRHATVEGRLSADELEERLEALYAARTYGEVDALVADLPAASLRPRARAGVPGWAYAAGVVTLLFAVLGALASNVRRSAVAVGGPWHRGQLRFPGPFVHARHPFVQTTSAVSTIVVLALCAAVVWFLMRSTAGSSDT